MKTTLTLLALAATTFAQVQPFTAMALRSASPIHFASVNAAGQKFWLTVTPTSSYCPLEDPAQCPAGTDTVFTSDYTGNTLGLNVEVPGGQQVYIAPDGSVSFTQAHSAYIPEGSILTGWRRIPGVNNYDYLDWEGGLVGCPVEGKGYQVFGLLPEHNYDGCLGFTAVTINATELGAWQYT